MNPGFLVSVVIPTFRRPHAVTRAVKSVLIQTHGDFEIIVIIDGPHEETRLALADIVDSRVHAIELSQNVGVAQARNKGMSLAIGRWIAFLDDDDEWLPHKLEVQVAAALMLGGEDVLMASYYIDRGVDFQRILPNRVLHPGETLSEFMFHRDGILSRRGHLQTSTYFASRRLTEIVLFRPDVRPQEDWDWLLRAAAVTNQAFHIVTEPLSIYHNELTTNREGSAGDFDVFWNYAHQNRSLFTPQSFSSYLATCCAPGVLLSPHPLMRWTQLYKGMKSGRMTIRTLFFAAVYAFFSAEARRRLRICIASTFHPAPSA